MANIFEGTSPPAWLQERAQRDAETARGAIGNIAGTLTSGFLNGFRRDENATVNPETGQQPRQGFMAGLNEAVMNQRDPMWKLRAQKMKVDTLATMASMESVHALGQEREQELKAWMADAPTLSPWLAATPEKRMDLPTPTAQSQKGMQLIGQVSMADQRYKVQQENSKVALGRDNLVTETEAAKLEMSPATGEAYDQLMKNGEAYQLLPNGQFSNQPSQKTINLINSDRIARGLLPVGASEAMRKDFEYGRRNQNRIEVQNLKGEQTLAQIRARGEANLTAVQERGQQMQDLETLRFTDRTKRDAELQAFYSKPPVTYPGPTPNSFIVKSGRATYIVNPKTNRDMSLKGEFDAATSALKNAYVYKQAAITSGKADDMAKANQMVYEAKDAMLKIEKRASAIARPATGAEIPADQTIDAPDNEDQSVPNPSRFKVLEVK